MEQDLKITKKHLLLFFNNNFNQKLWLRNQFTICKKRSKETRTDIIIVMFNLFEPMIFVYGYGFSWRLLAWVLLFEFSLSSNSGFLIRKINIWRE